jgi:hypothetical protein
VCKSDSILTVVKKIFQVPQEEATRQKSENQNNIDETKDTDKHNSYTGRKTEQTVQSEIKNGIYIHCRASF